jgi:hypothetical protein
VTKTKPLGTHLTFKTHKEQLQINHPNPANKFQITVWFRHPTPELRMSFQLFYLNVYLKPQLLECPLYKGMYHLNLNIKVPSESCHGIKTLGMGHSKEAGDHTGRTPGRQSPNGSSHLGRSQSSVLRHRDNPRVPQSTGAHTGWLPGSAAKSSLT